MKFWFKDNSWWNIRIKDKHIDKIITKKSSNFKTFFILKPINITHNDIKKKDINLYLTISLIKLNS